MKSNVGFFPMKLQKERQEQMQEILKLEEFQGKSVIERQLLISQNPLKFSKLASYKMLNTSISVYEKSCLKIIKISDDIDYNFLLTDTRNVQFFGIFSQFLGLTILEVMPITPKYIIALLKLDDENNRQPSMHAKNSFWDKKFPGLFIVNHKSKLYKQQDLLFEFKKIINENPIIKENKKDIYLLEKKLTLKYYSNEDLYYYPIYELKTKEQVHLINAMLHSQTYKYVAYSKGKDLLKAIETIKLYNIYRVEEG